MEEYVIEDIGEGKVALYFFNDGNIIGVPELVVSRNEAFMEYNVVGEFINGELNVYPQDEWDEDLGFVYVNDEYEDELSDYIMEDEDDD